jgi:hypothetical protein
MLNGNADVKKLIVENKYRRWNYERIYRTRISKKRENTKFS